MIPVFFLLNPNLAVPLIQVIWGRNKAEWFWTPNYGCDDSKDEVKIAEIKVTPFKTPAGQEKSVPAQQSSLLANVWEIKSKQINGKLKFPFTHAILWLYSLTSNGLMLQMKNLDYCCENNLCRGGTKLHWAPRNAAEVGLENEKAAAGRAQRWELPYCAQIGTFSGNQMQNVISKHLQKP